MPAEERYVHHRDGAWYVGDSGVSVYSLVALWQQGFSPEEIQASFSTLSLCAVYGTILYFLEHRDELEASFREQDALFQSLKAQAEAAAPGFSAPSYASASHTSAWQPHRLKVPLPPSPRTSIAALDEMRQGSIFALGELRSARQRQEGCLCGERD